MLSHSIHTEYFLMLTAVQTQWSWAYGLDVVLLASGYNHPESGATGSGIYFGRKGALSYYMSEIKGSRLLVSKVPKKISSSPFKS